MKHGKLTLGIVLVLLGAQIGSAQDSLRALAADRGRYVGSILNSEWFNNSVISGYEAIHKAQFNVVVAENEMKFDALEPSQNSFSWTKADKLVAYAQANGMRIRGHALAWHSQVPSWVSNGSWTRQTLLAVLKNHITTVVTRYKGKIQEWDVVNEAITDDATKKWRGTDGDNSSIWGRIIGADFIDSAFVWAHQADPDADLYYNDYAIEWGVGSGSKARFLLDACTKWKANGIPITGVGTQTHVANTHTGTPANVKTLATELNKLGLKLAITELDIGFTKGYTPTAADYAAQGHLYAQFMDVFLEAPNMTTFVMWGFTDKYSWLPSSQNKDLGLIYDASLNKKPAYDSLVASLKRHDPSTVISPSSSSGASSSSSLTSSSSGVQSPYNGIITIPGTIQAEDYDLGGPGISYYDSDTDNQGGDYRSDEVDIAGDGSSGYVVAWTANDEWLEYTISLATMGTLSYEASVASNMDGSSFHLEIDGNNISGPINVPNTEDWNTYTTVSGSTTTSVTAGTHVLRLYIDAASFNIDWIQLSLGTTALQSDARLHVGGSTTFSVYNLTGSHLLEFQVPSGQSVQEYWRSGHPALPPGLYMAVSRSAGQAPQHLRLLRD